ncbi:MAG TPA: hypothetical protein VHN98_03835 [Acidimicrobiales bacterium]|nr:hypothetical protein [Acidimicrobiales bacterium]
MNDPVASPDSLARLADRIDEQRRRLPVTPPSATTPGSASPLREHAVAVKDRAVALARTHGPTVRRAAVTTGHTAVAASRSGLAVARTHVYRRRRAIAAQRARWRDEWQRRHQGDRVDRGERLRHVLGAVIPLLVLVAAAVVAYSLFPGGPATLLFGALLAPLVVTLLVLLAVAAVIAVVAALAWLVRAGASGVAGAATTHHRAVVGGPASHTVARSEPAPSAEDAPPARQPSSSS